MIRRTSADEPVVWEQWGGVVQRGNNKSLILTRLRPKRTQLRAPGPGAMRTADWEPTANRHLKDRHVILHTDGAQAYNLEVDGALHDHVAHKRKKLMRNPGAQYVSVFV